jgi:hypothetical protein
LFWQTGKTNLAEYFTKHHPPAHHCNVRAEFLTQVANLKELHENCNQQMMVTTAVDGTGVAK